MTDRATIEAYLTDEVYAIIAESRTMFAVALAVVDENRNLQSAAIDLSEQAEQSAAFRGITQALFDFVDWRAVVERIDFNR